MTTITAGIIVNGAYSGFVPAWWESVAALTRQPDEVVAVTDLPKRSLPSAVRVVRPPRKSFEWVAWRNALADATETEWLAWVDVDDAYLPTALDLADTHWGDADVVAFGMTYMPADGVERTWVPDAASLRLVGAGEHNPVPNGSPVRANLARSVRWDVRFWPFSDWGFWCQAAHAGARMVATNRVDFVYRWHPDTPTDSDPVRREIRRWMAEEGVA